MNREDWLRARRKGLGGSDDAAILGLSPFRSAMDVWLDKTGRTPIDEPDDGRDFLRDLGTAVEPFIAKRYERETGRMLRPVPALVRHPLHDVIVGTPDRLVIGERRGVELKTENQFQNNFGDPGSDDVPDWYRVQCAHYIALMDYDAWDLALLHGGSHFAIYPIERDLVAENALLEYLLDWWDRHVVKDTPPELDGTPAWVRYLSQKFPRHTKPLVVADEVGTQFAEKLIRCKAAEAECVALKTELENRIKAIIEDNEGIRGPFGRITWKRTKDSQVTDFENALTEVRGTLPFLIPDKQLILAVDNAIGEILKTHTKPKPGVRRFLVTPTEKK
jgi:putative phage-type endonuclease